MSGRLEGIGALVRFVLILGLVGTLAWSAITALGFADMLRNASPTTTWSVLAIYGVVFAMAMMLAGKSRRWPMYVLMVLLIIVTVATQFVAGIL